MKFDKQFIVTKALVLSPIMNLDLGVGSGYKVCGAYDQISGTCSLVQNMEKKRRKIFPF